jgi:hypothetical protein
MFPAICYGIATLFFIMFLAISPGFFYPAAIFLAIGATSK